MTCINPSFGIPDTNVEIPNLNFWIQGPSLGFVIRISLNIHSQEHKLHTCDKSGSFCTCFFLSMIVLRLTISNKSCGVFFSFLRKSLIYIPSKSKEGSFELAKIHHFFFFSKVPIKNIPIVRIIWKGKNNSIQAISALPRMRKLEISLILTQMHNTFLF